MNYNHIHSYSIYAYTLRDLNCKAGFVSYALESVTILRNEKKKVEVATIGLSDLCIGCLECIGHYT